MGERLCPAQQQAYNKLRQLLPLGNVFALHADTGAGRTTVLRALHAEVGGALVTMKHFTDALRKRHPWTLEETFEELLLGTLDRFDCVVVDDLHLLNRVVGSCNQFYQRRALLNAPLTTLTAIAADAGKKVIFGVEGDAPGPVSERCHHARVGDFAPADYEFLCRRYLGDEAAAAIDYQKVFRFNRELNAHQLKAACQWFSADGAPADTERFIEYLRTARLSSNVDLGEVQPVELHELHGVDDVIRSLEANIVVPLENDALAAELNLKPKRGVLLAGPPGTGKTTVGRALAHRLRSKFFLLDGTFISGTRDFYEKVHSLFQQAKQNAPSIIFIDDSDVLFENREEHGPGLYRYLLTLLDGLESESAGRVCVMMTVMDVAALPPALVRSGRVELWLDMRLPDADARGAILRRHLAGLPPALSSADVDTLVGTTDGFSGADLKRLVEDGKSLLAYDRARGRPDCPATEYLVEAIETVRANRQRYSAAEARARACKA